MTEPGHLPEAEAGSRGPGAAGFATTRWSEVRRASRLDGEAGEALARLCERYWYPLYAFLRRSGTDADTAGDQVQSFFADLLARDSLSRADPKRGKFRSFLLKSLRHHVANLHRAASAERRGGSRRAISLDVQRGETRYVSEPAQTETAEKLFERRWALELLDAAMARLEAEYEAKGRGQRFQTLRPLIAPTGSPPGYDEVADSLGCSAGAVRVAVHRLRQQFAEALRDEIAGTLDLDSGERGTAAAEEAIEEEVNELMAALRGR